MRGYRRWLWSPIVPAIGLVWFGYRLIASPFSAYRAFGLGWMCLWLGLAAYDRVSGGRFTRWLYDSDEAADSSP